VPPFDFHRVGALPMSGLDGLLLALDGDVDVLRVDGTTIVDRSTLAAQFASDLGFSASSTPSWDGLSDSIRSVLVPLTARRAVIVWTHADRLARNSLNDLLTAVIVFSDLARAVSTTATGFPRALRLEVVLLGEGEGFDLAAV